MKYFCLSFDLEEFDIPLEFGKNINKDEMFNISLEGTKKILELIKKYDIKATFFVTTGFYQMYPELVMAISKTHEIACHGEHCKDYSKLEENEIFNSIQQNKLLLEKGIKKKVAGFRSPRMLATDSHIVKKTGIEYDASLHPTYIPGRYNHFFASRKIFKRGGLTMVPASVVPFVRMPFAWLWFRNLGLTYAKMCTKLCFLTDPYANIYFHSWEFMPLTNWDVPSIFKRNTGKIVYNKLDKYICWLIHKKVKFLTLNELSKKFN